MSSVQKMYEDHHANNRPSGFSVLKEDRGMLFASLIGQGKKVLDVGCRDGALTSFFVKNNEVLGMDIDTVSLAKAKADLHIDTLEMDLYSDWSALGQKQFDAVVAGEVLEHVFYPDRITKNIFDRLVPGGVFVGSVPNAFSLKNRFRLLFAKKKNTPLSDPTHINHFSAREMEGMLRKYFSEVKILGLGKHTFLAKLVPGLFAFNLAFYAKKA